MNATTSDDPDTSPFFHYDDNLYKQMNSSLSIIMPSIMFCIMFLIVCLGWKWYSRAPPTAEEEEADAKANAEMIEKNLIIREWQPVRKGKGSSMNTEKRSHDNTVSSGKPDDDGVSANKFDENDHTSLNKSQLEIIDESERSQNIRIIRRNSFASLNSLTDLDDGSCGDIDVLMGDDSSSNTHLGCAICLKSFRANDMVSESQNTSLCQHRFHKECILMWLERQNCCPLCKESYVLETPYEKQTA